MKTRLSLLSLVLFLLLGASASHAIWPLEGLPVGSGPLHGYAVDGAGGLFVLTGSSSIVLYRVDHDGTLALPGAVVAGPAGTLASFSVIPDNAGGVIVAWHTDGLLPNLVYAQRFDANGNKLWGTSDVEVLSTTDYIRSIQVCEDGSGGVVLFIAVDASGLDPFDDLYAQRLDINGAPQWPANNLVAETTFMSIKQLLLVHDGTGYVGAWATGAGGTTYATHRAQRIDTNGAAQWNVSGIAINSFKPSSNVEMAASSSGGVVCAWSYDDGDDDVYAQRLDIDGNLMWSLASAPVCVEAGDQLNPVITEDDDGNWVIAWTDARPGGYGVYGQRLDASGNPLWQASGVRVIADEAGGVGIVRTGTGRVVVSCGASNQEVNVRPVRLDGSLEWDYHSEMIETLLVPAARTGLRISDPSHAMVIRNSSPPRVQRFDLVSGQVGGLPPFALSAADNPADQGGRVLLEWNGVDSRSNSHVTGYGIWRSPAGMDTWTEVATSPAIYAQRYSDLAPAVDGIAYDWKVRANSTDPNLFWESLIATGTATDNLPPAAPLSLNAARSAGGVSLSWSPGDDDARTYAVFRGASAGFVANDDARVATVTEPAYQDHGAPVDDAFYVVAAIDAAGHVSTMSEEVAAPASPAGGTPALAQLTVRTNAPNPFANTTTLRVGLPAAGTASITVYDVAGRRVAYRQIAVGAGWNEVAFDGRDDAGRALASGVYFYRVQAGAETITRKFVIQR